MDCTEVAIVVFTFCSFYVKLGSTTHYIKIHQNDSLFPSMNLYPWFAIKLNVYVPFYKSIKFTGLICHLSIKIVQRMISLKACHPDFSYPVHIQLVQILNLHIYIHQQTNRFIGQQSNI